MIYNTFTASNSYKGFYSLFNDFIREDNSGHVYLIKGGPGCGKSTFMKKVASHFENKGLTVEQVLCSSDPDSLDGIKIANNSITIIDATPPHSFDMKYPGAVDSIIDLSAFWDNNKLISNKKYIIDISDEISKRYASVYSLLNVAGILMTSNINDSDDVIIIKQVNEYISKHLKQNGVSPMGLKAKSTARFLSAINCKGVITLNDTINSLCDEALIIEDDIAYVDIMLKKILYYLQKSGYDTIAFYNPLCPKKLDHIIVPQIRYGFFTSNKIFDISLNDNVKIKKIDSSRFIDKEKYENIKSIYTHKKKTISKILTESTEKLKNIKNLHDELEKYYINAMDYEKMNYFTQQFINSLFYC